jgi:hypothetical protein
MVSKMLTRGRRSIYQTPSGSGGPEAPVDPSKPMKPSPPPHHGEEYPGSLENIANKNTDEQKTSKHKNENTQLQPTQREAVGHAKSSSAADVEINRLFKICGSPCVYDTLKLPRMSAAR